MSTLDTGVFAMEQERFIKDAIRCKLLPQRPDYITQPAKWRAWYDAYAKPMLDRFTTEFMGGTVPSLSRRTVTMKLIKVGSERVGEMVQVTVIHEVKTMDAAKELMLQFIKGWDLSGQGSDKDDAPAAATPPKAAKKEKAKPAPEPEVEESEEEEEAEVEEDEEEETEEETEEEDDDDEEEAAAAPPKKLEITKDDLKVLKDAKKLREVLSYLIEKKGIKSIKALGSVCKAIKDKVPALTRIEDLEERLPGAAKLLNPNIQA